MRFEATLRRQKRSQAGSAGRLLIISLAMIAVVVIAVVLLRRPKAKTAAPEVSEAGQGQAPVSTVQSVATKPTEATSSPDARSEAASLTKSGAKTHNPSVSLNILPRGEPTAEARAAVAALTQIDLSTGAVTPTQAAVWKESLRALVAQGESAVPAIREFLEKNLDLNFGSLEGGSAMGASSLRMALLNAMQEIGGEQAIAGSLQALQTSADPAELALLAAYLQKADPEQYRDSVLAAAHEALDMAATGKWDGRDVAPLFDVLKTFGGEAAARDLERYANVWFNYTPLVLAELPDGAGIDALIRLNADGAVSLGKDIYQRMLAQVSIQSEDAAAALLNLSRAGKVSPSNWQALADALMGTTIHLVNSPVSGANTGTPSKSYHVAIGNQNFFERPASATMSAEEVNQRISIIDKMLAVAPDSGAVQAMQSARTALAGRL